MTIWSVDKDAEALTMRVTAEFTAPIADVWQLWADPRLLERWWGPPGFPATFEHHDLTPGGTVTYFMGSGDERFDGHWTVLEVDAPNRLVVADADVDENGTPTDGNGLTRIEVDIASAGAAKTRMVLTAHFDSIAGMEQQLAMGIEEGMTACMSQIDDVLADVAA